MALDKNGYEITPGDTLSCKARYYQRVKYGQIVIPDAVSGNCIESDELSKEYGFDAKFKGENFIIVHFGPHSPYLHSKATEPNTTYLYPQFSPNKGTNQMLHCAIRVDGINTTDDLCNVLNSGKNSCIPHYETNSNTLRTWVENDIKLYSNHQWLILSPVSIAEIAGPPVRFRSVK